MDPRPAIAGSDRFPEPIPDPFSDDRSFEYTVDHRVDPAARPRFLATMAQLAAAESRWPGFLAGQAPQLLERGPEEIWRSRIRWRDLESWLAWMDSEERRRILSVKPLRRFISVSKSSNSIFNPAGHPDKITPTQGP